jgi:hypothetical protein
MVYLSPDHNSPEPSEMELDLPLTLTVAALAFDMPYWTLAQAVREGRVEGRREGGRWTVTLRAIHTALEQGHLRPDWGRS